MWFLYSKVIVNYRVPFINIAISSKAYGIDRDKDGNQAKGDLLRTL